MKDPIKKNILDLYFQKYNAALNTTIVVIFTLLIGLGVSVAVGLLTKQLEWEINLKFTVFILSVTTLLAGMILINYFYKQTRRIIKELKQLRKEELNNS